MNTNTAIGAVIAVVVVLGGGYYLMNQGGAPIDMPSTSTGEEVDIETPQAGEVKTSLDGLAQRSGSWKCTVDTNLTGAVSSGVSYVADGKVRSDISTKVQGYGDVETHLLVIGDDFYTWSSLMSQGTKLSMAGKNFTPESTGEVSAFDNYIYDCQPWTADASLFVVPANITFTTVGQ